jgi:vacuolar-type H+-ATPase catalytic subunit A/Vma1
LLPWFAQHAGEGWEGLRSDTLALLAREAELREVAGLVGAEALQDGDRLALGVGALVREHLLGQSAFERHDAASSLARTSALATLAHGFHRAAQAALGRGVALERLGIARLGRELAALRAVAEEEIAPRVAAAQGWIAAGVGAPGD